MTSKKSNNNKLKSNQKKLADALDQVESTGTYGQTGGAAPLFAFCHCLQSLLVPGTFNPRLYCGGTQAGLEGGLG